MLLVAMNDISLSKYAKYDGAKGIGALSTNQLWVTDHANAEWSVLRLSALGAEAEERRRHDFS